MPPDQRGGGRVELALHQPLGLLGEHDLGAAQRQRPGGGDPEEPAADHDGPHARPDRLGQAEAVVQGAEGVDALRQLVVGGEQTAQRREHRVGAGGQHEGAVSDRPPVREVHGAGRAVDAGDPAADQPGGLGQGDDVRAVASGQHLGEQDAVVRAVLLVADERHVRAELAEAPGEPYAREAGADHHHTRIRGHANEPAGRVFPGSIPSVSRAERCPQRGRGLDVRVRRGR